MDNFKLSQQFYTNLSDIRYIFQHANAKLKAEILMSELDFNYKSELVLSINSRYDAYEMFNLIGDLNTAIQLAYQTQYVEYVRNIFKQNIDNDNFVDFYKVIDIIRFQELVSFSFYLLDHEYNQQLFNKLTNLYPEKLSQFITQLHGNTLNYFCSKRPRLISYLENSSCLIKDLTGRNQYRYIVSNLMQNEALECSFANELLMINGLIKYYPQKLQTAFLKCKLDYQMGVIKFLLQNFQHELAHKIYSLLDDMGKAIVNQECFAFYNNDYDLNTLHYFQLRQNIDFCYHDQFLINSLAKLDKSKVIDLFERACDLNKEKAEKILFNIFSIVELIQICEVNLIFTKSIIQLISNKRILSQLAEYPWFWNAMCARYMSVFAVGYIVVQLDSKIMLNNIHLLDKQKANYLFNLFYRSNKDLAYQLFSHSTHQLAILMEHQSLLTDMIDCYGFDYIVSLGNTVEERREMLKKFPLKLAIDMVDKLGLTANAEEFKYLNGGRCNALMRRLN